MRSLDDAEGEASRVLAGMNIAEEFYMQEVAQVKMEPWAKGRVALVGDAGFCPSPISGMGTTLAIVGAYVLAGEIVKAPRVPRQAFGAYEGIIRPFVVKGQKPFPGTPQLENPDTALGIRILHAVLGLVAWSGIYVLCFTRGTTRGCIDAS
jgi:2-polyprenyl-6-methoxyphenol hydroxylase-like FAD-dependent oxidoreductase